MSIDSILSKFDSTEAPFVTRHGPQAGGAGRLESRGYRSTRRRTAIQTGFQIGRKSTCLAPSKFVLRGSCRQRGPLAFGPNEATVGPPAPEILQEAHINLILPSFGGLGRGSPSKHGDDRGAFGRAGPAVHYAGSGGGGGRASLHGDRRGAVSLFGWRRFAQRRAMPPIESKCGGSGSIQPRQAAGRLSFFRRH